MGGEALFWIFIVVFSILMLLGPLMHEFDQFLLPYAGGCDLGARTVHPHMSALHKMGLTVEATEGNYHAVVEKIPAGHRSITLIERGDTVTENAIMAAARTPGVTTLRNASPNARCAAATLGHR